MYITPEQFVARLGYSELLLYCSDYSDTPDFSEVKAKNVIKAIDYSLFPKFEANTEEDTLSGIPDRNIFTVDRIKLEGNIKIALASYIQGQLDYPIGMLFEHLRTAWVGIADNGRLVSPLSDKISSHPWFSIGSAYHGIYKQCLVDKMDLSISGGGDPVQLDFKIVSTNYSPESVFSIQNLNNIISSPEFMYNTRILTYGKNCSVTNGDSQVVGHFGLPDASNSTFASGINKPGSPTLLTNFSISIENNLKPVYTTKSNEYEDYRKRFSENIYPSGYFMSSARRVTGSLEWFGNVDGQTFIEKITGPASIQNKESLYINCGSFIIEIKEPVWSVSEKQVNLDKVKRVARFSGATDGDLIVQCYSASY